MVSGMKFRKLRVMQERAEELRHFAELEVPRKLEAFVSS